MPKPNEKLAESLAALQKLQKGGHRVFRSKRASRTHRERLLAQRLSAGRDEGLGDLSSPSARAGDSTPWYASFWEFAPATATSASGDKWHLSPEQSLFLHGQNTVIPKQVVVYSPKGTNHTIKLLFGTSLYDLKQKEVPSAVRHVGQGRVAALSPAAALVRSRKLSLREIPSRRRLCWQARATHRTCSGFFSMAATRQRQDTSPERFAASAVRRSANEIVKTMKAAGYDVREVDPFAPEKIICHVAGRSSSYRRAHAGDVGINAGNGHQDVSQGAGFAQKQEGISAFRGRHLQERCLPLPVD